MPARSSTKDSLPAGKGAVSRPCQYSFGPGGEGPTNLPPEKKSSNVKVSPDKVVKTPSKTGSFKSSWMKKAGSKGQPSLQPEINDDDEYFADSSAVKRSKTKARASAVKFEKSKIVSGTDEPATSGGKENAEADEGEEEERHARTHKYAYMDEEGKIGTYYRTIQEAELAMENSRKMREASGDGSKSTKSIGRVITRGLVLWHRKISASPSSSRIAKAKIVCTGPRMIEKLLLCLQYECHKAQINLPWDKAVHRLNVGSSGTSALQHLSKTRDQLTMEGHMTPPALGRNTADNPATLRGFTRDMEAECANANRAVRWSEEVIHPKKNLDDSGIIKGSGNYRGNPKEDRVQAIKNQAGENGSRIRIPAEVIAEAAAAKAARKGPKRAYKRRAPKAKKEKTPELGSDDEIDPTELNSDDEYHPSHKKGSGGRTSRFNNEDPFASPTPKSSMRKTSRKNRRPSLIMKLSVSSESAKQKLQLDEGPANSQHTIESQSALQSDYFRGTDETLSGALLHATDTDGNSRSALAHTSGTVGEFGKLSSEPFNYQGKEIHGEMHEYMAAIMDGSDPLQNGTEYISNLWDRPQNDPQAVVVVSDDDFESLIKFGKHEEPLNEELAILRNSSGIDSFQVSGGQMEVDIDGHDEDVADDDGMMQSNYGGDQVENSFIQDTPSFGSSMHHHQNHASGDTFNQDIVNQDDNQPYAEVNEYGGTMDERAESPSHFEMYTRLYNGTYDLQDEMARAAESFER
ncbi:hypothetical protein QTJ16_006160 [Diplocarpon rosae]|uniref:Uncharacterized protein n=1 Tax=Diplocarpon rosae TaxID=946125 RepID=A0AAD9WAG8_9HELO|nr:hypothetical protein QTJ16_006160 [Diplocarpon rosae]